MPSVGFLQSNGFASTTAGLTKLHALDATTRRSPTAASRRYEARQSLRLCSLREPYVRSPGVPAAKAASTPAPTSACRYGFTPTCSIRTLPVAPQHRARLEGVLGDRADTTVPRACAPEDWLARRSKLSSHPENLARRQGRLPHRLAKVNAVSRTRSAFHPESLDRSQSRPASVFAHTARTDSGKQAGCQPADESGGCMRHLWYHRRTRPLTGAHAGGGSVSRSWPASYCP